MQSIDRAARHRVRIHYLDWLRVPAVLAVVAFHAELPFGVNLGTWPIQDAQASDPLGRANAVIMFLVPVFFLLAGARAQLALRKRRFAAFLSERATRTRADGRQGQAITSEYKEWSRLGDGAGGKPPLGPNGPG